MALADVGDVAAVQADERPGERGGKHGDDQQRDHAERVDPPRVPLAAVRVLLGRADQHRHHDRGEDAAEHQVVHRVRQGVGVVVGRGEGRLAEGDHQHERAQEPGATGRQRAECHHLARPGQVRRGVDGALRPGRRQAARVWLEDPGPVVLVAWHEARRLPWRCLGEVERLERRLRIAGGHRGQERGRRGRGPLAARRRHVVVARREARPRAAAPATAVPRSLPVVLRGRARCERGSLRSAPLCPAWWRWRRVRLLPARLEARRCGPEGRLLRWRRRGVRLRARWRRRRVVWLLLRWRRWGGAAAAA